MKRKEKILENTLAILMAIIIALSFLLTLLGEGNKGLLDIFQ